MAEARSTVEFPTLLQRAEAVRSLEHEDAMKKDKTDEYRARRDFERTSEPKGSSKARKGGSRFVIQKHDASSLHYDFRLQVNDRLVSWAVPKGPSTDPRDKRLAVQTEDHPLEYADFEGVIPEGEYGAGAVIVWDRGSYENLREEHDMEGSLDDGLVEVRLDGDKIHGGYALKRIRDGKKPQWLLIKKRDDEADARRNPTSTETQSVKSGREIEEVAKEASR